MRNLHKAVPAALVLTATLLTGCSSDDNTGTTVPTPTLEVRRLTENEAFDANPVFSADGAWIYYESDQSGDREIWRLSVDGGEQERLTHHRAFDSAPDPLPGGGVVFESDRAGTKDIWMLTAGASVPAALTSGPDEDGSPAVSPDGSTVVFESNRSKSGGSDLWLVTVTDGELRRLTTTVDGVYVRTADWSPDGRHLVFESNVLGGSDLLVVPADGGDLVRISPDTGYEGHPAWSPDGETIAFESARGGTMEIYLVPAGGGGLVRVTDQGGFWPQWSPDGLTIVYGMPTATAPEVGMVKIVN